MSETLKLIENIIEISGPLTRKRLNLILQIPLSTIQEHLNKLLAQNKIKFKKIPKKRKGRPEFIYYK